MTEKVGEKWPSEKRVVILTRGLLGGCATQACAVKDGEGKTPLQWAEENKAPEEVVSLLRAALAIELGQWGQLVTMFPRLQVARLRAPATTGSR